MGRSSRAALDADQAEASRRRHARMVTDYCKVTRGERFRVLESAAELAEGCTTGAEAAGRLRAELARLRDGADLEVAACPGCGRA